jgi:hypothetical protein
MGPAMHLKQIERGARQQQMFEKAIPDEQARLEQPFNFIKGWAVRLAQLFAIPRAAG